MGRSGLAASSSRSAARVWRLRHEVTTWPFTLASELPWFSGSTRVPLSLGPGDFNDHASELYTLLDGARQRLWFLRSALIAIRGILLAVLAVLALTVLRLFGASLHPLSEQVVVGFLFLWTLVLIFRQRIRYLDAARVADRNLRLGAQLGTAVELIQTRETTRLARPQIYNATVRARTITARQMVPFRWPVRDLKVLGLAAGLLIALNVLTSLGLVSPISASSGTDALPGESTGLEDPYWAEMQATEMGEFSGAFASTELQSKIDELNQLLQSQEITAEEYAERLAQMEAEMRERAAASAKAQSALSEIADALRENSTTREVAEALNRGDYQRAAQALAELGKQADKLSPQARQELANSLRDAAQRTEALSPELSQSAQQAAEALSSGNAQATEQSFQQMGDAINQASQSIASQSELGESVEQLRQERGMPGEDSEQYGEGEAAGAGESMMGEQAGGAAGQQQEGQGAGMPTDGTQVGGGNDPGQSRQSAGGGGPGAGGESGQRELGGAKELGVDASGKTLKLQGKADSAGQSKRDSNSPNAPLTTSSDGTLSASSQGGSRGSLRPVDAYSENNYVPIELRPVVRGYFSGSINR